MEKWVRQEAQYQGPVFSVVTGEVMLDDSTRARRDVVRHPGSVAIVPLLGESVLFVKQYRISIEREILEIPAGRIEKGETPESAAGRELSEELGYVPELLIHGSTCFSSVGFLDERVHMFLALQLTESKALGEWDEGIRRVEMPLTEVRRGLDSCRFEDSKTIIGLHELLQYLSNKQNVA